MTIARPRTLEEALRVLGQLEATIVAGGTDVMVEANQGRRALGDVVAVRRVDELRRISADSREIRVGAAVPYSQLTGSAGLSRLAAPVLYTAARFMGSTQIRSAGTLGGNIGTASPVGDALCALMALDARATLATSDTIRDVPVAKVVSEGLSAQELLVDVHWPAASGPQQFLKVCRRGAVSRSVVSVSLVMDDTGAVRLVLGGCADLPIRLTQAEGLAEQLARSDGSFSLEAAEAVAVAVSAALDPPSDIGGSSTYRRHVAGVLVRRALTGRVPDRAAA
ncbi:MAG TPA: FAD binding domain-containing protein [Frankiaceae bacterium]|nr:FAD binding domain-containing protein [Frankiaceae bacterium]